METKLKHGTLDRNMRNAVEKKNIAIMFINNSCRFGAYMVCICARTTNTDKNSAKNDVQKNAMIVNKAKIA